MTLLDSGNTRRQPATRKTSWPVSKLACILKPFTKLGFVFAAN
jgi:hypothetical protein